MLGSEGVTFVSRETFNARHFCSSVLLYKNYNSNRSLLLVAKERSGEDSLDLVACIPFWL